MARQYARRTFLRRTPNKLLDQYFQQRRVEIDAPWADLTETGIEPLDDALDAVPNDVLRRVDGEFSQIMQMASAKGVATTLEEAASRGQDGSEQFAGMSNDYERAMWTFLNEPARFIAAGAFHEMDRRTFSWHRFVGLRLEAETDDGTLDVFGAALAAHYRRQGRGRHCHVDVYRRVGPDRYCYFAYPEDAASTDLGYDEQGRFQRRPRQSAFEVIFVYRPEEGTTELYARGNKRQKEELAEIFCVNALGLTGLPDENGREPFNLAVLKDPTFTFPTDPRDGVQSVDVRLLRLDLPDRKSVV